MKKVVFIISIFLSACGGAATEVKTDTAAVYLDTSSSQSNTTIPESIEVRHKYSYVKLVEDGSKVAGLLELYGTNDYTQAVTINGFTQSGRGTFYVNGDKVTLSRTSGIAIDGVSDGSKIIKMQTAGFIAQELDESQNKYNAEWLNLVYKSNPNKWEATYGNLLPVVVKSIQELSKENTELKERLKLLEDVVQKLISEKK